MKKLHTLLLLLGLGFLAYLVGTIGLRKLWSELTSLGWGLVPFILIEFVAEGVHTLGWRCCLSGPHRRLPWFRIFRIRMAGLAVNYLTPTASLGGEVTKAALLTSHHRGPEAVSGVLLGKLCAGVGHLVFVAVGSMVVLWCVTLPRAVWAAMWLSGALVAAGILTFLLLQKYGKLGGFIRWLAANKFAGQSLRTAAGEISNVDDALKTFYRERPRDLVLAVGWHVFGHSLGILQTWWFFSLLHQPASAAVATCIWVLGMWFDLLTFGVPLNLGTLEGSRAFAVKMVGYNLVVGMTYGIALRLAQLFCAGFGLVNYALLASQTVRAQSVNQPLASEGQEPV